MQLTDTVLELNMMFFAWFTTIQDARALAHKGAEYTVLHMKHRHMLVQRQLKPI